MILLVLVVLLNGTAIASSSGDMRGTEGTYVQTSMTFDTLAACLAARDRITADAVRRAEATYVSRCGTKADTLVLEYFTDKTQPLPAPNATKSERF